MFSLNVYFEFVFYFTAFRVSYLFGDVYLEISHWLLLFRKMLLLSFTVKTVYNKN